jgi:hypothetical protein
LPTSVHLVVPAHPRYVHVMRSVATGYAAQLDLPIDHVDDVRLAVSECCNRLLSVAAPATTLGLSMEASPATVTMRVSLGSASSPWPPSSADASLALIVITRIADSIDERVDGGMPMIETTWHLLARA